MLGGVVRGYVGQPYGIRSAGVIEGVVASDA